LNEFLEITAGPLSTRTHFVSFVRYPPHRIDGECVHLFRCQFACNCAHLLVDVVLPRALCESRKLAFNVSGVLALQCRGSELVGAGAMTS
jgi:hypothetical protein